MSSRYLKTNSAKFFTRLYGCVTIHEAVELAAQNERESLLPGYKHLCKIPVDVNRIARERGISFGESLVNPDKRDAVLQPTSGGYLLRVAPEATAGRDRFSIAHEIGHTLFRKGMKHQVGIISKEERDAEEYICQRFASALLMPSEHIKQFIEQIPDGEPWGIFTIFETAARHLRVSLPALIYRLGMVKCSSELPLVVLCLRYFSNVYTGVDERLRVEICSALGTLKHIRTWYNRSAAGLNLRSAETLFTSWMKKLDLRSEPTGGKYAADEVGKIMRAKEESLKWIPEEMCFSVLINGKWQKQVFKMLAANCLYTRKGWREKNAYVVSFLKLWAI